MKTLLALNTDLSASVSNGEAPEWVELIPAGPKVVGRDGRSWLFDEASGSLLLSSFTDRATTSTFLKPSSPTWVDLSGSGVIPSGGTWAYSVTNYTGGGSATGSIAGVAAGGTTVGAGNCHGFAWRIQ